MNELPLPANTMLPVELKLAVWLGLVKAIRIVRLKNRSRYGLLIEGRWFRKMLDAEIPVSNRIHQTSSILIPQPRNFFSVKHARQFAESIGVGSITS